MYPDYETFLNLSGSARMIPICEELNMDTQTPIGLFMRYTAEEYGFLLESAEVGRWGRYSFIGRRPFLVFKSKGQDITIVRENKSAAQKGDPFEALKALMKEYNGVHVPGMPRLCGGAVGYIGYDMVRRVEHLPDAPLDDTGLPESHLGFYGEVIAFDHLKQRVIIMVNADAGKGGKDARDAYRRAGERIRAISDELGQPFQGETGSARASALKMESTFTRAGYMAAVERAKEYIRNGDIFQAVLSQRLSAKTDADPFSVYRILRTLNPSPYLYYLRFGDTRIAGSSPEMLARVEDGAVETCPIAGTARRGGTVEEDERVAAQLLADEKEMAEHTMLVDLGRNDIGKVSRFGSVQVVNPMRVEKFSHVMHIVSNVKGEMRDGVDAFDVLRAVLPAGTLSGAPKVRAMQIIDELEPVKRGCYGGCVGYIGFDGNLDTCIAIRTVVFHRGRAYIQAGAGIVADSVPAKEYEETLSKAQALFSALGRAGEIR